MTFDEWYAKEYPGPQRIYGARECLRAAWDAAQAAEREACAVALDTIRLAEQDEIVSREDERTPIECAVSVVRAEVWREAAAAIRARGEE